MSKYTKETYENLKYGQRAMETIAVMFSNKKIEKAMKESKRQIDWVNAMVAHEPDAVIELIAAHRRQEPEDVAEHMTPLTLPVGMLRVLNDPEMQALFHSAGQMTEDESSGSLTENTEGREET